MAQSVLSNALCSLQDLKDYLGITSTTFDTRLTMAVNQATRAILDYTDRTFASTSYTEDLDGTGTPYLQVTHYPIIGNPTQVNIDGSREFKASTDLTLGEDYVFDDETGIFYLLTAPLNSLQTVWPRGKQNVRIAYTAGYSNTPDSLKHICVELAAFFFKNQGTRGHQQQALGGIFVGEVREGIPPQFREQLDPWRRVDDPHDVLDPFEV